ncbi:MAG TPA: hypothetical protein VK635_02150 [Bradyrhizobium sp.]|nr:hypothetical protein [Bradyrhizobium sp.]
MSNAGLTMPEIGRPTGRWVGQMFRTLNILQQQSENSRKRILLGMNNLGQRKVAYWSIDTPLSAMRFRTRLLFQTTRFRPLQEFVRASILSSGRRSNF